MAKSGKVVQLFQKPENFIKTRARLLPIGKCYITQNWEEAGIANIIVTRIHTNGNITYGAYLIDIKCLGIKNAFYQFNISEDIIYDILDPGEFIEVDYNMAHNIIYGSEAFANDYGFKPNKDWGIAQFILEEDDERIPIIDVEFGEDGIPAFYVGPSDTPETIKRTLATLDKNAGLGNYLFIDIDDDDDEEELFKAGEIENIITGKQEAKLEQKYALLKVAYVLKFQNEVVNMQQETANKIDEELINEVSDEMVIENVYSIDENLDDIVISFAQKQQSALENNSIESINQLKLYIEKNPQNPYPYLELFMQYKYFENDIEADSIADKALKLFPDFLYSRFIIAHSIMLDGDIEKGFDLLGRQYYINKAYPHRYAFSDGEFTSFYATLCEYFIFKDDINNAIICADFIIYNVDVYYCSENAINNLCTVIAKKVVDAF